MEEEKVLEEFYNKSLISNKPIGLLEGKRSFKRVFKLIKGNETINLNQPIGFLKGMRPLA